MIQTIRAHFKAKVREVIDLKEFKEVDSEEMPENYFFADFSEVSIEEFEGYNELTIPVKLLLNVPARESGVNQFDKIMSNMEMIRKGVTVKKSDNLGAIKEIGCLSWNQNKDEIQGNQYKFEMDFEVIYKSLD